MTNNSIYGFDFSHVERPNSRIKDTHKGYFQYGVKNDYPQVLLDFYNDCSLLSSLINNIGYYVYGNGFDTDMDGVCNRKGETFYDIVTKATIDYMIYGAFAIQTLQNAMGEIVETYWVDARFIRISEDEEKVVYCKDWLKPKDKKEFPLNNPKAPNTIWYFKNKTSRDVYGSPIYNSAIPSIQTLIEIGKFNLNIVGNKFLPTTMISFCSGEPSEEDKIRIENAIRDKFQGSEANLVMLNFCESTDNAPIISSIQDDNYSDKYNALNESCQKDIYTAFRVSPMLMGVDYQSSGFNNVEWQSAFSLYQKTFIRPLQTEIERHFATVKDRNNNKPFVFHFNEFDTKEVFQNNDLIATAPIQ